MLLFIESICMERCLGPGREVAYGEKCVSGLGGVSRSNLVGRFLRHLFPSGA
jgi:hypothetical protein